MHDSNSINNSYPSKSESKMALKRALTPKAALLLEQEHTVESTIKTDTSIRIKILDNCGMACTFCHNEGTPVTVDNRNMDSGRFVSSGASGRVSVFLNSNGAKFVSGMVQPSPSLDNALTRLSESLPFDEVHLTGGEPTLHSKLPELVESFCKRNLKVKITSNGERFYQHAKQLSDIGLEKVVFSIFGTTPEELASVQGGRFSNISFSKKKLEALDRSITSATATGIDSSANIVMPSLEHSERVVRIIQKYGDICKIRILNSLDEGIQSYVAVYELLASLGAQPIAVNLNAGASGMSVDYQLPDGKIIGFKQIRKSYLSEVCSSCHLKDDSCEEGFYGVRMYIDQAGDYKIGVCIQRMDLTVGLNEFVEGDLPDAIIDHRLREFSELANGNATYRIYEE